ncbi:MAG: hypothetical protein ACOCUJ_02560 [Thiohalospira sp.]|uniref:hypothetical protein n=1 Tax=Thiohalospira sp. TaxID=3080549 RepID=UPI00397EC8D6
MRMRIAILGLLLAIGASPALAEEEERESRLRFKDGPVCMCSNGTSEADIRKAEESRAERAEGRRLRDGTDNERRSEEER